ncbi:MAG: trigger factor family protein, partial [Candidatus Omnitrophica bacterium]|nr:trigger factor family protein [Candidatus Omnitrophota bacterium]
MKLQTNLQKQKDSVFVITIKIDSKELKVVKKAALVELSSQIDVKGFRKGKAPENVVEKKVDKTKVNQVMVQKIASQGYSDAIKEHQLKAAIPPQVSLKPANKEGGWEIEITSCEIPNVDTSQVEEEIKKVNAKGKIWTPEKGQKDEG